MGNPEVSDDGIVQRLRAMAAETAKKITAKRQKASARAPPPPPPPPPGKRLRQTSTGEGKGEASHKAAAAGGGGWRHAAAAVEAAAAGAEGTEESSRSDGYTIVQVPDDKVALLIGRHGSDIKKLQAETGAIICVGKLATEGTRKVCITGCCESQAAAKAAIECFIAAEEDKEKQKPVSHYMEIPAKYVGSVIGTHGAVINRIKATCGVMASFEPKSKDNLDDGTEFRFLELRGSVDAIANACQQVEHVLLECYRRHGIFNAPLETKYGQPAPMPLESCRKDGAHHLHSSAGHHEGATTDMKAEASYTVQRCGMGAAVGESWTRGHDGSASGCFPLQSLPHAGLAAPQEAHVSDAEAIIDSLLQPWVEHYAGDPECVQMFEMLMEGLEESLAPGVEG
eukprot:TRINITY_DN102959_c0_g1_i1.p1 TRINITY_DN102959_c0_g1~~TRINITY_DN102959_c0_g1_i1.p1  ORF type:complete len:397 (+),score=123.29 TRINITY_DN102959_c0_g1_i1:61-1251(+)